MYIGLGIFLLIVGAILYFAVGDTSMAGIDLTTVGIILMIAGALAIVLSLLLARRRPVGYTSTRESQVDPNTGSRIDRTDIDPR